MVRGWGCTVLGLACLSLVGGCTVERKHGEASGGQAGGSGASGAAGKANTGGKGGASVGGGAGVSGGSSAAGSGGSLTSGGGSVIGEGGMGGDETGAGGTGGEATGGAGTGGDTGIVFGCGGILCAVEAKCVGTGLDAVCACPAGFTDPRGDGTLCQDIDECVNLNGGCDPLVPCKNTPGSFTCGGCPAGYSGTPSTGCVDINECVTSNGGCDPLVTCTNTPGARVCGKCPFGYSGDGASACTDINECTTNNGGCDKNVACTNTPGGHTCGDCPAGYTGGGSSGCTDINECAANNGGCDSRVTCTNTAGSFSCGACPSGYTGTGATGCVDINECAMSNGGCDGNATCTNTAGSRTCACKSGYTGDGVTCADVNECATNNGGCNANATCTNTTGGRTCACKSGYSGDGVTCADVNECATNNGGCSANATCTNTTGGRTCACKSGFSGDGLTCADVNECATSNGGCSANATCTNTTGSRTCACNSGYSGDGVTCADVNECATNNGGCSANATCTNTAGGRTCACKSGFAGDGITCTAPGTGCRWNCNGSNCVQVALDNDSDGHGTTACAAAPGDDCDDTQAGIYPGATEICDGIDNDCDKKIDMADGLPLVGAIQTSFSGLSHAGVAYVSNDGSFGLVGTEPGAPGLFAGTISTTGVGSLSCCPIFSVTAGDAWLDPHLAWGVEPGNYGIAYAKNGRGGLGGYAGMMAFTSCCWVDVTSPGKGDVTARGQGDLLFAGMTVGNLGLMTQTRSGTPLSVNIPISGSWDSYDPLVASNGTSSGVIWQTSSPKALNWALLSASLAPGATETLSTSALYADLEAISAGYGIAWIEGVGFKFMIKKANGSTQCTSAVVPFGTVPSNQQLAVSDSANGNIVVATSPDSNLIHLYRFDNSCKPIDDIAVSASPSAPTEPRVVHGGSHVVVYWTETGGGRYRFLSDQLCH